MANNVSVDPVQSPFDRSFFDLGVLALLLLCLLACHVVSRFGHDGGLEKCCTKDLFVRELFRSQLAPSGSYGRIPSASSR